MELILVQDVLLVNIVVMVKIRVLTVFMELSQMTQALLLVVIVLLANIQTLYSLLIAQSVWEANIRLMSAPFLFYFLFSSLFLSFFSNTPQLSLSFTLSFLTHTYRKQPSSHHVMIVRVAPMQKLALTIVIRVILVTLQLLPLPDVTLQKRVIIYSTPLTTRLVFLFHTFDITNHILISLFVFLLDLIYSFL